MSYGGMVLAYLHSKNGGSIEEKPQLCDTGASRSLDDRCASLRGV